MIDELEALGRFRNETPGPSANARLSAQSFLDAAIAAERGHHRSWVHRPTLWRLALAATAVAVVAAVLIAKSSGDQPDGLPGGLRRAILAAYDAQAAGILHVHQTRDSSNGLGDVSDMWSDLTVQQSVQHVRTRHLTTTASGVPLQDFSMSFALPEDRGRAFSPVGEVTTVDYPTHTWSYQANSSGPTPPGATPDVIAVGSIRNLIANNRFSDLGPTTLEGKSTIELVQHNPPGGKMLTVWIDSQTNLPIQELFAYSGGTVTSTVEYLPPTPVNLAQLNVTVPAGFTQTAMAPSDSRQPPLTPTGHH
jgi:hypothetical protein